MSEIEAQETRHANEVAHIRSEWDSDLEAAATELNTTEKQHANALAALKAEHKVALDSLGAMHAQELEKLQVPMCPIFTQPTAAASTQCESHSRAHFHRSRLRTKKS
jgi:hypothetical protein